MSHASFKAAPMAAEQFYQRGVQLVAARQFAQGQEQLQYAAGQGHVRALCYLAVMRQYGWGQPADPAAAIRMFRAAAANGDGEASARLAISHLHGRWLPFDAQEIATHIVQSARAQHPLALRTLALLSQSSISAGGNLAVQQSWLTQLSRCALRIDAGRLQTILLAWFAARPSAATLLHAGVPAVRYVDGVLNSAECSYLIENARPNLKPARVVSPVTHQLMQDPVRTNQSAPLGNGAPDLTLALIEWRIAQLAGLPLGHAEYCAALRYGPGEQYRPHRDYLIPHLHPEQFAAAGAGQRTRTAFAYLNNVQAGGETAFPQLGVNVQPLTGRVVIFDNVDATGQPEPRSLHAGTPVIAGEKWLATLWFRERPLRMA